jgi:hypothetical protein
MHVVATQVARKKKAPAIGGLGEEPGMSRSHWVKQGFYITARVN